jgi:hypothetical protein
MVGSPLSKQGFPMSKIPFFRQKQFIFFLSAFIISLIPIFVSKLNTCIVSDHHPRQPVTKKASAMFIESACKKAQMTCALYSSTPKDCKIISHP